MSEDNILNLELEEEEDGGGAPNLAEPESELGFEEEDGISELSGIQEPAVPQEEPSAESTELVAAVTENVQQMISSRLEPVRAGLQQLAASIRQIEEGLSDESAIPGQRDGHELNGLLGLLTREAEKSATRTRNQFEEILAEERRAAALMLEEQVEATREIITEEAELRLAELTTQLEASRQALALAVASAEKASLQPQAPPADDRLAFTNLRLAVEEINSQRSQADTLSALIRNAALFAPRIAFFVVKAGVANGWKASGFANGLTDESVKSLGIQVQESTTIGRALLSFETVCSSHDAAELCEYGSPAPVASAAIPLVVRGRAAAVLYADSGLEGEESINLAALETIMKVGSMGIELLPTRRAEPVPVSPRGTTPLPRPTPGRTSIPLPGNTAGTTSTPVVTPLATGPSLASPSPASDAAASGPQLSDPSFSESSQVSPRSDFSPFSTRELKPVVAEPSLDQPATEVGPDKAEQAPASPELPAAFQYEPVVTPENGRDFASGSEQVESEFRNFTVETGFAPSVTPEIPRLPQTSAPQISVPQILAPETPARITKPVPGDSATDSPVVAERPAPPPLPAPTESEQRAHNDARRFARLLVSEIKLYNAAKVSEGRKNFNLYTLLREEIDRSRKVYDKRVSPAVATKFDYFYDELLQTLAEGDTAKLGEGCPGPILR